MTEFGNNLFFIFKEAEKMISKVKRTSSGPITVLFWWSSILEHYKKAFKMH